MATKRPIRSAAVLALGVALLSAAFSSIKPVAAADAGSCNTVNAILVESKGDEAVVTIQSSVAADPSSGITFASGIPSECGNDFKRCPLTLLRREGQQPVLIVSLVAGAGLIMLEYDGLQYRAVRFYTVPYPDGVDCHLTTVFDLRVSVLGLCLNLNDSVNCNVFHLVLSIDFDNLTLSQFVIDNTNYANQALSLPTSVSEFVLFNKVRCDHFDDIVFFLDDAFLMNFNVENGVEYDSFDTQFLSVCMTTSRVARISNQKLVAYCVSNTTLVMDVCERETVNSNPVVTNIQPYVKPINGTPHFCNEHIKLVHNATTLTLSSEQNGVSDFTVPVPARPEDVLWARCITFPVNATFNETVFVYATKDGRTRITAITENVTKDFANTDSQSTFIQQGKYLAVNSVSGSSQVFNLSCSTDVPLFAVDHPVHLMLVMEDNDSTQSCQCTPEDPTTVTSPDPTSTGSTSTGPTTSSSRVALGATLGVLLPVAAVAAVVALLIGIIIANHCFRKKKYSMTRELSTREEVHLSEPEGQTPPAAELEDTVTPPTTAEPAADLIPTAEPQEGTPPSQELHREPAQSQEPQEGTAPSQELHGEPAQSQEPQEETPPSQELHGETAQSQELHGETPPVQGLREPQSEVACVQQQPRYSESQSDAHYFRGEVTDVTAEDVTNSGHNTPHTFVPSLAQPLPQGILQGVEQPQPQVLDNNFSNQRRNNNN